MTKKANGVYYTPQPIVEYIVSNTLGPLVAGKSPMQLAGCTASWERDSGSHPLTVLDPACGSGHLLLGAYQFLLDWCLQWYSEYEVATCLNGPSPKLRRVDGSFQLTTAERHRILNSHIYGVDIDEHAIEIAKQALRAKMSAESTTLENIRCGNSLIDSDIRSCEHKSLPPHVRAFDWRHEFPSVITSGGFDAIVANPPYVNARLIKQEQGEAVKQYFRDKYRCARRAFDLYTLFVERSHQLLRAGGRAGMIVPNKIATLDYARPCRELLLEETTLDSITDVSHQQVFQAASVYPYLITWTKTPPTSGHRIRIVTVGQPEQLVSQDETHFIRQAAWDARTGFTIHRTIDIESRVSTQPLALRGSIHSGTTGFSAARVANALREYGTVEDRETFEFIVSGNIDRYSITLGNVRYMNRTFERPGLPKVSKVLSDRKRDLFAQPKIVIAGLSRRLEAATDSRGLALGVQVYAVAELQDDPRFLLGLLNSKLMSHLLITRFQGKHLAGGYLAINKGQLMQLPIRSIDEKDELSILLRDRIIEQVERFPGESVESDREIDRLVYELYALTDDEISEVERSFPEEIA